LQTSGATELGQITIRWREIAKNWQRQAGIRGGSRVRSQRGPRKGLTAGSPGLTRGAINLQIGGEFHDQVGEPLRKLWGKVWPRLPQPLGPALLPQSLQGRFPCENSEGLCAHEKVVWRVKASFIPKEFLARVGEGKTISKYRKDQIVFSQGEVAESIFYIQQGKVKLTVVSEQGKEAVVAILGPGQFFGEACLNGHRCASRQRGRSKNA
jgi:hypothetical protein